MCYCCGKKGHHANKCLEKDKQSKEEWAVKKAMMHAQANLEKESKEKEDDDDVSQSSQRVKQEEQDQRGMLANNALST
jgi:hypothetical protein